MSALNVVVFGGHVFLVTDGAYYDAEQTVRRFGAKVMTLPHVPAAVATVGPAGLVHLLGGLLYHEASNLEELMESSPVAAVAANASTWGVPVRVVIAGVCSNGQPAAWQLDGERFERIAENTIYTSPTPDDEWEPAWDSPATFEAAMVELVTRQREAYPVGGFVALTTITPGGIVQKVLHRWPDRIGDTIGPPVGLAAGS